MGIEAYLNKRGTIKRPVKRGSGPLNQPVTDNIQIGVNVPCRYEDLLSNPAMGSEERPIEQLINRLRLWLLPETDITEGDIFITEEGKATTVESVGDPGTIAHHLECILLRSE